MDTIRARRAALLQPLGVSVALTALFAAILAFKLGGATVVHWVDNFGTALAAVAAAVLCARAAGRQTGRLRRFWWLLAAATGAWAVGELTWSFYELILEREVPAPSIADIAYIAGLPLAVAALLAHPAMHRGGNTRKLRSTLDGLVLATALLFLGWTLVLGSLWRSTDLSTLAGLVNLAYPFSDVILVFFIVLVVRRITGRERLAIWCLLGGLLATSLADSTYAYLAQIDAYASGNLIDTAWVAGYLWIGLGAYVSRNERPTLLTAEFAAPTPAAVIAPFAPMLAALSVAGIQLQLGHHLDRVGWGTALALVVLVLARQLVLIAEILGRGRQRDDAVADRLISALGAAR
jgi:hypothetical protein